MHTPPVSSKQELLKELYSKLEYPDSFGFNWDALDEIYGRFWWIDKKNVIIVHECLSTLPRNCQAMFVFDKVLVKSILHDMRRRI